MRVEEDEGGFSAVVTVVLGFSTHSEARYARKMMQAGAMGYVTKNSSREELFKAIEEVAAGRKYICKELKDIF